MLKKPGIFSGVKFKSWQPKMMFYLTNLNFMRFFTESPPTLEEGVDVQAMSALDAWKHSEYFCRNYVLIGLVDELYNVYFRIPSAKELWDTLERKYKTEDTGTKKHNVTRFLDFKMIDSKTLMSQVQDLQILICDIIFEGMTFNETFQVAAMIEKLPPSSVDFKNYHKHKRKEMTVEDLVFRVRIEEDNRVALKGTKVEVSAKANMVEHG
ncbi:uncharacterized protein LOC143565659 [Bidens hawaiensis]|uniref:uncharacterized protein LOC143565659 n=1 Tax=Bidens hawaiensis TaxID=980011 RepID=UPI00404A69A8